MIELFKYCHENNIIDKFYTHKELKETKENILRDEPFDDKKSYYISTHRGDLRSHQVLIEYIFERGIKKIIVNNTFTPYFYNVLLRLDFTKYCDEIVDPKLSDELGELGDLIDTNLYENITNFKFETKLPRHFTPFNI
jgi:FMN phosphatase YigB (HAD superfamily)